MKKIFLIPLLTLLCTVMAWAHNGHTTQLANDVAKAVIFEQDPDNPYGGDALQNTYYFATIDDAFAAQENSAVPIDCEIQLLKNATASATLEWPSSQKDASWRTNSITLDLNGHTLNANAVHYSYGADSKFTIKNGTFIGTLDYGEYSKGCFYLEGGAKGLGGTITCNVSNYYSSTAYYYLNSGTISANLTFNNTSSKNTTVHVKTLVTGNIVNGDNNKSVQLKMAGNSNVNLAKITGDVTLNNKGQLSMDNYSEVTGTVTMNTGSTLTVAKEGAYFNGTLAYNAGSVSITAGKFNFDPTSHLTSKYSAQYNSTEGVWNIVSLAIVNVTKGFNYTDANLMTAYADAEDGDSLCVYKATTLSDTQTLNKAVKIGGSYTTTIAAGSNITFSNPNQKIYSAIGITYDATVAFNEGTYKKVSSITNGDVTINGANVTYTGSSLTIPAGKTFTLAEGSFTGSSATINVAGTLNINGGSMSATKIGATSANAKLYMTAGNLTLGGNAANYAGAIYDDGSNAFVDFSLTGGTITMKNYTENNYLIKIINEATGSNVFAIQNMAINSDGQPELYPEYPGGGTAIYIGDSWRDKTFEISNCNIFSRRSYGIKIAGGTCTLKNNIIEAYKAAVYGMFEYSNITISSGTYSTIGDGESIIDGTSNASITVVPSTSVALFNKEPDSKFAAEGKEFELIEGWYQLKDGPVIAIVNDVEIRKYSDLRDAFLSKLDWLSNNTVNVEMQMDYNLLIDTPLEVKAGWTCNLDLNGHVLTVNGRSADKLIVNGILNIDGTDADSKIVSQRANCFKVNNGGELNINGGTYKTTQQQSENITYQNEVKQIQVATSYIVRNLGGTVNLTNATFDAGCYAVDNLAGSVTIKGGAYSSSASVMTGEHPYFVEPYHQYGYAIANAGTMSLINATVTGVHGAVICKDEKGVLDIDGCELITENSENLEDANGALVVATNSMVTVKNTKMKSPRANYAAHVGDLDEGRTFGIVNLYAGCYLTDKMYVEQATASAEELLFPMSVAETSAWYEVAVEGGVGPLPAGYEYATVENAGDDADEYAAGYRYKVVLENEALKDVDGIKPSEVEEQETHPEYTIPWQKNTTWVSEVVPEDNTIVTIPVDAVVAVSQSENVKEAVAEQIFVSAGATLKVEQGTTLTVGEGGINIAYGGQLIVEDQAIVTVGEAGIVTANENAIVIKSDATGTGAFLIHPDVTENTRPAATVQMYAKAHKVGENWFPQHCGIPTVGAPESIIFPAGGSTYMDKFVADGATPWEAVTSISNLEPFVGYRLNFSGENEAGVYTFKGNLQGNGDAPLQFVKPYYNLLANSYTSPMDIKALFDGLTTQYEDNVDLTLWVYNSSNNRHEEVSKLDIDENLATFSTIAPMQGYILYCGPTQAVAGSIDYQTTIWNCAQKIGVPIKTPARKVNDGRIRATIVVTSATSTDKVVLREADNYSNAFENGADARKYMSENVFNIYSTNDGEAFSQIATDNLLGTAITVKTANETAYTLSFSNVQNFNYAIRDNLSGAIIPVEEGMSYEFTMNEGTTVEGRFEVVERYNTPTGVENVEAARSAKGIYTVLGQYLGESSLLNTLPTGIYVVDGQRIVK